MSTPAGTYRVTVAGAGNSGSRTTSYTLIVRANEPPADCQDFGTTKTGTLTTDASGFRPDGRYFYTGASGTHRACLDDPANSDFNLSLQKWNGSTWTVVAQGNTSTATENLTYAGVAGSPTNSAATHRSVQFTSAERATDWRGNNNIVESPGRWSTDPVVIEVGRGVPRPRQAEAESLSSVSGGPDQALGTRPTRIQLWRSCGRHRSET